MTARTWRGPLSAVLCLCLSLAACESGFDLDLEVRSSDPEAEAEADARPEADPFAAAPVVITAEAGGDGPDGYDRILEELEPWEIYRRCHALVVIRDFARFDRCIALLEDRLAGGTLTESGFAGREWNLAATTVRLQELRAESWLDRGALLRAEEAALAALEAAENGPNYVIDQAAADWLLKLMSRADYGDPEQPFAHFKLRPLALAAAVAARRGDRDTARAYLDGIDAFDPTRGSPGHEVLYRRWKAVAHFVLGDYEEAYLTLNRGLTMGIKGRAFQAMIEIDAVDPQAASLLPVSAEVRPLEPRFVMELEHEFMRLRSALETDRLDIAREGLDALLQDPRLKGHPGIYARVLRDRGRVAALDGAPEGAAASFAVAIDLMEATRGTVVTGLGKLGGWHDRRAVYADMVGAQLALGRAPAAFLYAERARARERVDRLARRTAFADLPAALEPALAEQNARELRAARLVMRAQPVPDVGLVGLRRAVQDLAPALTGDFFVQAAPVAQSQALLGAGEAVLSYFYDGGRLFGFALTRSDLSGQVLDGEDLDVVVDGFGRALLNPRRRAYVSGARRLYNGLIAPFEPAAGAEALSVVADGPLHRVPFAVLQGKDGALIETHGLRFLPSVQALHRPRPRHAAPRSALLLMDPSEPGQPSPDLPGAPAETAAILRAWPDADVAVGRTATETFFKQRGPGISTVHLAARCNGEAVLRGEPALLLVADDRNDGRLEASELADLRLGADLVTLSRCHPGARAGEPAAASLGEVFLKAGAGAVVGNLWPLADEAAGQFLERFYRALRRGGPTADALRTAQRETAAERSHPYYWAGFQWLEATPMAPGEG